MGGKFKRRETYQGKKVSYQEHGQSTNHLHPAFCLKYLDNSEYGFPRDNKDRQAIIIQDIYQLCQKSWQDIALTARNKGGKETIAKNSIKKQPCTDVSLDEHYLAFYIGGDKGRMVGCRRGKIFYVFWFDFNFSLYAH